MLFYHHSKGETNRCAHIHIHTLYTHRYTLYRSHNHTHRDSHYSHRSTYTVHKKDHTHTSTHKSVKCKHSQQKSTHTYTHTHYYIPQSGSHIHTLLHSSVRIIFGFNSKNKDHFGIMMYRKNRLIKSYE